MTIIDNLILNIIHVTFPFLVYLFYIAYKKTIDDKENKIILIITVFSTLYLSLKYNKPLLANVPLIAVNIPLLISYYKQNNKAILVSSVLAILYYYNFYQNYIFLFLIIYIIKNRKM